jgi:hypothetical protein
MRTMQLTQMPNNDLPARNYIQQNSSLLVRVPAHEMGWRYLVRQRL